jgi:hypothetical protein
MEAIVSGELYIYIKEKEKKRIEILRILNLT